MNGLLFTVKSNYGKPAIYPVNKPARLVALLVGKRTVSARDLALCQALGFGMALDGNAEDLAAIVKERQAYLAASGVAS